jgi:predicted DNA-binding WGR domain protein
MLRWETDTKFYTARLQQDLFGGLSIIVCWGSHFSRQGGGKYIYCEDGKAARKTLRQLAKRRRRHGYQFVGSATASNKS